MVLNEKMSSSNMSQEQLGTRTLPAMSTGISSPVQSSGHQTPQQIVNAPRPLIPGGPPATNAARPVAPPPVTLSTHVGPLSAGTAIPPAIPPSLPKIPPPQAGMHVGPLLPAGPRGFAGTLGVSPNQPLHGSGGSGIQAPPVGPRLGLPSERPPIAPGESNIHGAPMLPPGSFVPLGTPRPPLTVPYLGISTNPISKVVSGGMPPVSGPPVQLVGSGGPRPTHPLVDPNAAASVRPMPPQATIIPSVPQTSQLEVWFQHITADGRSYYSHSHTKRTTWERPTNAHIVIQPPPGMPTNPSDSLRAPISPVQSAHIRVPEVPVDVPAHQPVQVWSQHQTPEGKFYYYNSITRQSVWEKPVDFMPNPTTLQRLPSTEKLDPSDVEERSSEVNPEEKMEVSEEINVEKQIETVDQEECKDELHTGDKSPEVKDSVEDTPIAVGGAVAPVSSDLQPPVIPHLPPPLAIGQPGLMAQPPLLHSPITYQPPMMQSIQPVPPLPHIPEQIAKEEPKGPRPVKSIPVAGTPWSVVWSSDNRRFFFNATNRMSVWNIPEDLDTNPLIHKILEETAEGKKRVGEMKPAIEAKRFKHDDEEEDEDDMDSEDKQQQVLVGLTEDAPAVSSEAAVLIDEEKIAQMKANKSLEERQREFKEMLLERGVSAFSTWEKELPKFVFDPRCKLLKVKERKSCFEEYIIARAEEERKERKNKLKEKREKFHSLLEEAKLHSKSSFSDFAFKYSKDERFKSVEKMREREQLFTDYLAELKKVGKHKEEQKSSRSKEDVIKVEFLAMLGESEAITERSQWKKIKSLFDRDPRYKAVESSTQREEWFLEHVRSISNRTDPNYERQERIQASLKEREREVKLSRTAHEKEWNRERDQLRKSEALQHYKALLVDMVRNPGKSWHDVKRNLRRDHRWELAELLESGEKEKLFQEHIEHLIEKKRVQFRQLLEETTQISLTMPWRKARKLIKEDPRYKNFGESDQEREIEYDEYLKDRMVEAKNEFRALLKETKAITYRSHEMIKESNKHYKDIIDVLEKDRRYLVLECVADERKRMLESYVEELHRRGPPPPPTATHPGERLKRPAAT